MSGVLVIAESRRGELRDVSLELIGAGQEVKGEAGGRLAVAAIGAGAARHVGALGAAGVDEVLTIEAPGEDFEAHVHGGSLEALIEQERPALVLLGHTIDSLGYGPAVAARRGLGFASDVTASPGTAGWLRRAAATAARWRWSSTSRARSAMLLTLRAGAYTPAEGSGDPPTRAVEAQAEPRTEHLGFRDVETGDVDITKAEFLLSIGRGIEDEDALPQFEELADKMGATLSVSRPLVDAGWVPNARQVGQSGKTVKPKVYLALGNLGRRAASGGDADGRHDHRRQHRPRGADLQRRPLRGRGRPVRRRGRAGRPVRG